MDITKLYLDELSNTHSTQEITMELFSVIRDPKASDKDRKQAEESLLKNYLLLVVSMIGPYKNQGVTDNDLISEGNLGLITAIQKYDVNNGGTFGSYARRWIKASIVRNCMHNKRIVKIPENISELIRTDRYKGNQSFTSFSIDTPFEDGGTYSEKLPEEETNFDFIRSEEEEILSHKIESILSFIKARDADIVKAVFGIGRIKPMTVEEAATYFGIGKTRINQIVRDSLKLMRSNEENVDRSLIEIVSAEYGTEEYSTNVTNQILDLITSYKSIKSGNRIAGDPCKGEAKFLRVEYLLNGISKTRRFSEGKLLKF